MPVENFDGRIVVVDDIQGVADAIRQLRTAGTVGFDTETRPNFSRYQHHKIALIQLATQNVCFLFRINRLGAFPPQLAEFINDSTVKKVGLSLQDDFHSMRRRCAVEPANFIDLQDIVHNYGIEELSLQKIYAIVFGKKISKRSRLSNWDADSLTPAQQQYAALDAWACLHLYQHLLTTNY